MDFFHDWTADAQLLQEQVILNIPGVSFYKNKAFSILTQTRITGEQTAARKYKSYDKAGLGAVGRAGASAPAKTGGFFCHDPHPVLKIGSTS